MTLKDRHFSVLDHGFIVLKDYMGTDREIEESARISYSETRDIVDTRNLLRYMMNHGHTSPFEMTELKFHIKLPIYVMRQWGRHRTACLSGDTLLYFDLPSGKTDGSKYRRYNLTLKEVYQKWQPTKNKNIKKQRNPYHKKDRVKQMLLRQVNEDTLQIQHTNINNIYKNGIKDIFEITLDNGLKIKCTKDHRFLFNDGWYTLKQKTNLHKHNNIAVYDNSDFFIYTNGIQQNKNELHKNKEWLFYQYHTVNKNITEISNMCQVSYSTIRKYLKNFNIQKRCEFQKGHIPWNYGKTYKLGSKTLTKEHIESIRKARSGSKSNFWKGGITNDRANIGRWTTKQAIKIHTKNNWTCQLCGNKSGRFDTHHIIPVWTDENEAKNIDNLTTLCKKCHKKVNNNELEYVEILTKQKLNPKYKTTKQKPRIPHNKITIAKPIKIKEIKYLGQEETYDIEVKGPYHNFIANGIVTHNSINEISGRYSKMKPEFNTTNGNKWRTQSTTNKQGSEGKLTFADGVSHSYKEQEIYDAGFAAYEDMLDCNIAKEQARKVLPLSLYTEIYWKIDLHNLFHFLKLRCDSHAQQEIREYAWIIAGIVKELFPISFEAWQDYVFETIRFSRQESYLLHYFIIDNVAGEFTSIQKLTKLANDNHIELSKREIAEFYDKLQFSFENTNFDLGGINETHNKMAEPAS